ncbi:MAG: Uncharacterised protein [Cryomorphaceae bacterium]|nr:MAG: Uncharacterised protein [Cryomorphaceae bacterium]
MFHAIEAEVVFDVAEIGRDKYKIRMFGQIRLRIGILVKRVQFARSESFENGFAVTAAPESNIDIDACWVYVQPVKAFL